MRKIFSSLLFAYLTVLASGAFKEVPMLESPNIEETKPVFEKIENNIENKKEIVEDKGEKQISQPVKIEPEKKESEPLQVKNELKEGEEIIKVTEELTEEKLQEIIKQAAAAPVPEVLIDVDEEDSKRILLTPDLTAGSNLMTADPNSLVKKYYDFLESFNEKLQEHDFTDKTEVIHIGHEVAKELTSDKVLPNFEVGVGMTYQGSSREAYYFEQEQSGKSYIKEASQEDNEWESVPVYATGKYRLPQGNNGGQPYLKLNFGYSVSSIGGKSFQGSNSKYKSISDSLNYQNGAYYGMGGGIEYTNGLTLDLMYQVNEGTNTANNSDGESRITFSVEYKLDI